MNFPKLTKKQKIAIAAGVGIIILIIVSVVCVRSCGSGNSNSNVINLAKTYADKGEYDRALSLLDTILLKDADNLEVLALLDEIIQLKKDAETGKETSSNVTVDIDTDGITNAMQDSISSMKDALAESNKQAEENRLSMERKLNIEFMHASIQGNTVILHGVSDSPAVVEQALQIIREEMPGYDAKSAVSIIHDFKTFQ